MTNKHEVTTFYSTDGIKMLLFKDAVIEFTDEDKTHHAFNISNITRLERTALSLTVFFPADDKLTAYGVILESFHQEETS
jgi:hypothetical protein